VNRLDPTLLAQVWPRPARPRPIVILGAGGIVRDAHLPAYAKAGFPVAGVYDINPAAAQERAKEFNLPRVYSTLEEAVAEPGAVFDVATPPKAHESVLARLPDEAAVLIQKPMGPTLEAAGRIAELCQRKRLKAAVNFQLRFSAPMLAIRDLMRRGELGDILDVEVHLNINTPWDIFPFLAGEPRVEILMHTIHYLDSIRLLLGTPRRVFARVVKHPRYPGLADARSSVILDYGDTVRCCLSINHCHAFGGKHQDASIRVEGSESCAIALLGLLLDYPRGRPDGLEVYDRSTGGWVVVPLAGRWFPDAFIGTMSNLQRFAAGEDNALLSPVEDALQTMRLVEACYISSQRGGVEMQDLR